MKIQLHTPKGIVEIDSETVSDQKLASLKMSRASLKELIPRDLATELDTLKQTLTDKGLITP